MQKTLFLGLVLSFCFTACTMAPKYTRPATPVSAQWPSGPAYAQTNSANISTNDVSRVPDLNWREFFTDDKLKAIIERALANNRDLRAAALNVEKARALYGIQRSELLPVVDAGATAGKTRIPKDFSPNGQPQTVGTYSAGLGAVSWELDFFGRIRSLKEEALQQYFATEQARRNVQIVLVSSVAQTYLALVADRETLGIAQTTLETQQASYDLIKHRYDLGLANNLDVSRAQVPVDTARRDVATYTQQVAKDENALNLLVGSSAAADWTATPTKLSGVTPPREIGPGLSSEVLLRRPDVLQAEDQLKAANADIGAARANFFPRVSLTAAIGAESSELDKLFKSGSGAWSYTPQVVLPIFDPRTWYTHRASKVQRDLAVAQYEKAIQSAFRDVADTLAVRGTVDRQVSAQASLVNATAQTYRLAYSRYDKGLDSFLSVLDAQRSLFAAQQGLVLTQLSKRANEVKLYEVLGGGGEVEPLARLTGKSSTPSQASRN
jgi:multidrug efflux system outer membrane protein